MTNLPNIATADWLCAPGTQAVFAALKQGGFQARAVGGAVRNTLMGRPVNDIDIATEAPPMDVVRLAEAAKLRVYETGLQHGTVTIVSCGIPIEVTTLRTDVSTDGRRAKVAFTRDWRADAARRDFTINALYCDADGTIFDPLSGFSDVERMAVRFIGDATARIREDYLRILRFFRFAAVFGDGTLDEVGLQAVRQEQEGLDGISAERKRAELLKTLVAPQVLPVLNAMEASGILARLVGEELNLAFLADVIAIETELEDPPDPLRRLAAIVYGADGAAERLASRLRLSGEERDTLKELEQARRIDLEAPASIRASHYLHGRATVAGLALLQAAERRNASHARQVVEISGAFETPVFPITGSDLLEHGLKPGPEMGELLRALERRWISSDFALSQGELLSYVEKGEL